MTPRSTLQALALSLLAACAPPEDPFAVAVDDAPPELPAERFHVPVSAGDFGPVEVGPALLVRELELFGRVELDPRAVRSVVARFDAVVASTGPAPGDRVEEGDVLAVLESRALSAARTALVRRRHDLEYARLRLEREEQLLERELTPAEAVLERRHAVHEAELALGSARKELLAMGLEARDLRDLTTEGLLEATPWTDHEVPCPFGGRILFRGAWAGESVAAGDLMFRVADVRRLWARLQVPLAELELLPVGSELSLHDPGGGSPLACSVRVRLPEVDADTQLATVVAELNDSSGRWRPGTFVSATARLDEVTVPVAVPDSALSWSQSPSGPEARVFVELSDSSWEARRVELGRSGGGWTQVTSGLEVGERVATRQMSGLKSTWLGGGGLEE